MRILLAQNALYYPSHGGGDKSNRLLMEALAARGHECRVVARFAEAVPYLRELASRGVEASVSGGGAVKFARAGVDVRAASDEMLRSYFATQVEAYRPEVILTSTDDPAQRLLDVALRAANARVVYLARATLAVPFGPDCAFPSEAKTVRIRAADRVVGVSRYVADYFRRYAAIDAVHVPISLLEPGPAPPDLGGFDNEFVVMGNPCAVKGIAIFLALADAFSETAFAAVPTWGTNEQDRATLLARANVRLLDPVDDMDQLFRRARVWLVPSLWAEARSRIVLEAMLRGVPVMAAEVGGIPEAKMGVPYLLPVNPIRHYASRLDEQMVPVAEVPEQDVAPWREALHRLLTERGHYGELARASRAAALAYADGLSVEPFEALLGATPVRMRTASAVPTPQPADTLSPDRRRLLALRLRKRAPASAWFPGADAAAAPRLFWFPHAGGGTASSATLRRYTLCPVRLPGRESRLAEAPFESMSGLVTALAEVIEPYLEQPFAFFGHSMGGVVAFELARELRRRGRPLPAMLIASAARAPQYRRDHVPPPPPADEQFLAELRRLQGIPAEVLDSPGLMRAILPALKADTAVYRRYVYAEGAPLDCPLRAYGGCDDPHVRREHLEAWAAQTTASFAARQFSGGHFYIHSSRVALWEALDEDLS